nr:PREDICTED: PHD finger protein 6-like isoform X2 [Latimeria chalumnae]|eukprot:XP_014352337.1 PREDICTED: PHD finger protein 6-like isoform X2 [Latimeria chalumnae]
MECAFCHGRDEDDITEELLVKEGVTAHVNCMLFSSNLATQDPQNQENFVGFRLEDVKAEIRRGRRLKCSYCKKPGASVGCEVPSCRRSYHYPCAVENGAKIVEEGPMYRIYCKDHETQRNLKTRKSHCASPLFTSSESSQDALSLSASSESSQDALSLSASSESSQDALPFSASCDLSHNASPPCTLIEAEDMRQGGPSPSQADCLNEGPALFNWLSGAVSELHEEMRQTNQHLVTITTILRSLVEVQTQVVPLRSSAEHSAGQHHSAVRVQPPAATEPLASTPQGAVRSPNQKGQKRKLTIPLSDVLAKK